MLFNSLEFILLFLPVVLVGYFIIDRMQRRDLAFIWLVGASFVFYGWWNWAFVLLLAASVVVNYLFGLALAASRSKPLLTLGVTFNLGLLGWFKYAGFFANNINTLLDTSFSLGNIALPLAISFFTFQQIAYLMDVYQGQAVEYTFHRYCLFVTFFPQLIAGPIVHHSEMLPQFARGIGEGFNSRNFSIGISIFAVGLIKKLAIADPLGQQADRIFEIAAFNDPVTFIPAWYGTIAFGLQIYFDFSGYTDMALGLARIFGVRLPLNFNSPYKATSIIDFWRRWHMTLSRFLRDYLYFPLGGNKRGSVRRYTNLMIVMLLGGLWHGAEWTFVVWGGLHGFFLCINNLWQQIRRQTKTTLLGRASGRLLTLFAVFFAWVFFRAEGWDAAMIMVDGMTGQAGVALPESYSYRLGILSSWLGEAGVQFAAGPDAVVYPTRTDLFHLFFVLFIVLFLPNTQQWFSAHSPTLSSEVAAGGATAARPQWRANAMTGLLAAVGCFAGLVILLQQESHAFIYFQF